LCQTNKRISTITIPQILKILKSMPALNIQNIKYIFWDSIFNDIKFVYLLLWLNINNHFNDKNSSITN